MLNNGQIYSCEENWRRFIWEGFACEIEERWHTVCYQGNQYFKGSRELIYLCTSLINTASHLSFKTTLLLQMAAKEKQESRKEVRLYLL